MSTSRSCRRGDSLLPRSMGLLALLTLAGAPALAQVAPEPVSPSPSPSPSPAGALGGPTIEAGSKPVRTLIERDFDGKLRRLEISAEEAALEKLTLTEDEKSLTAAIFRERSALLDGVVGKNTDLLIRLQGLRESRTPDGVAALRQMAAKLEPLRKRGRLRDEIASVLEVENQKLFVAMVDEYHAAVVADTLAELRKDKPGTTAAEATGREMLLGLGQEIRRSYERTLAEKTGKLEEMITLLKLDEAQEAKVRSIALEFGQQSMGRPTPAQTRRLLADISRELTPEQRATFVRELYARRTGTAMPTAGKSAADPKVDEAPEGMK